MSHRNAAPFGFNWPEGIVEKPILTNISGNTVTFQDGSQEDYDVIVKCTGYHHFFPFMSEDLTLETKNRFVPDGLYRQCVFMKNPKLFYMGMQNQFFTFSMFQLQGWLIRDFISGKNPLPDNDQMQVSYDADREAEANQKTLYDFIRFQGAYCDSLSEETGQEKVNASELLIEWCEQKAVNILTYRDQRFKNMFTGKLAPENKLKWIDDVEA